MQSVPREWLDFLRQQFPKDSRIQLTEIGGNPRPISPGSTGKLDYIDDAGQFHVKWDNGCTLALVLGEDRFSVYFDMGGCEYLESRIDATEYGELLPTVDDAVCGLISILDAMNTGDNDRFHLETLHHSKQEIRRILERGGKIDRTVEYAVDDEEEEYEQYHGFSMRM